MRLNTILIDRRPVMVISTDAEPPMPDEALDTWLGQDLQILGLWDGDMSRVTSREATVEETSR